MAFRDNAGIGGFANPVTDPSLLALLGGGQGSTPTYDITRNLQNQVSPENQGITTTTPATNDPAAPNGISPQSPFYAQYMAAIQSQQQLKDNLAATQTAVANAPMDKETARKILSGAMQGDIAEAQKVYYGAQGAYNTATGNASVTDPNQEQVLAAHQLLTGGSILSDAQKAAAQGTMDNWYQKNPLFEKDVQGTFSGLGPENKTNYAMNNQQWGTATAQDYAMQQIQRLLGSNFNPAQFKNSSVGPAENSPYQWTPQRTINVGGNEMNVGEIAKWYQGRDQATADAMLREQLQGMGMMQGMDAYGNAGKTPAAGPQAPRPVMPQAPQTQNQNTQFQGLVKQPAFNMQSLLPYLMGGMQNYSGMGNYGGYGMNSYAMPSYNRMPQMGGMMSFNPYGYGQQSSNMSGGGYSFKPSYGIKQSNAGYTSWNPTGYVLGKTLRS